MVNPNLRIVAVEEHFTFSDLFCRIDSATLNRNGWPAPGTASFKAINPPALADTGEDRMAAMKAAGICMQVLSVPGPGAEIVSGPDGITIAGEFNDRMARLISAEPGRFEEPVGCSRRAGARRRGVWAQGRIDQRHH